jgi:hypothetical protein
MNNYSRIWLIIAFVSSLLVAYYSDNSNNLNSFILTLPNILGILLAGILAALAIIFGMTGIQELYIIQKIEKEREVNIYSRLIKELKCDTYLVFIIVIVSIILPFFLKEDMLIDLSMPLNNTIYHFRLNRALFVIDFTIFTMSLIATYDIIKSLFDICEFKYEAAKK